MGIFDFFKKKKPEIEQIEEKISFEDSFKWIDEKKQEIKDNQKQGQKQINEEVLGLLEELKDKIKVLKEIDLEDKKAPERVKLIVIENLHRFIDYLEKLMDNLEKLDSNSDLDLKDLINKINSVFSEFEKKSLTSFQKSTFLIGKELGEVRDSNVKFFKSFNKIVLENKSSIEQSKTISIIEKRLSEIEDLEKIESENEQEIEKIEDQIVELDNKINKLTEEIENKKKSKEYIEQIESKKEFEKEKTRLVTEMQKLKEIIDFKALAKTYHSIEGKMRLVKEYKDNFKETYEKYDSEKLVDLVDIKEIDKKTIGEKIEVIKEIKQKIDNNKIEDSSMIKELEKEIDYEKRKIQELDQEKFKKQKLNNKSDDNKKQIKDQIIEEFKGLNVVVE